MREVTVEELEARAQLRRRGYGFEALCAEMKALGWIVALWLPPTESEHGLPLDRGCSIRIFKRAPMKAAKKGGFPRPRATGDLVCAYAGQCVTDTMLNKIAVAIRAEMQVNGWLEPLRS